MIRPAFIVAVLLSFALHVAAQPLNPRIRVRVVGDNLLDGQMPGTELSSTVYVDEVGSEKRGQLDRIDQFLKNNQLSEAADMLLRLSETDLNKLASSKPANSPENVASEFVRFLPLSQIVNELVGALAAAAPETLVAHRHRVDPLAKQWFEEAEANRDASLLNRLINESFHSSYGDNALLTLGDWSLEQAKFDQARRHYRRIHQSLAWQSNNKPLPYWQRALRGEVASALAAELTAAPQPTEACIKSEIPRAQVWARMVLTSILQGDHERANAELAILKKAWPDAMTTLGGRQETWVRLLSQQLTAHNGGPKNDWGADWYTFAGNAARNAASTAEIDISIEAAWRTDLTLPIASDAATRRLYGLPTEASGDSPSQPCSHFPIVVDGLVIVKDNDRLRCLDLKTGTPAWSADGDGQFFAQRNVLTAPAAQFGGQQGTYLGQHRSTLFAGNELITATMGTQRDGGTTNTTLIGFDLLSQGAIQFGPVEVDDPKWTFHGAPVHDAYRCWIGMRLRDTSSQDFLACFDVHTGQQLWRTRICSAETLGRNAIESTCNFLLTKHEDTIYVSSHLGTVVAVSSVDGTIRWATKYPRRGTGRKNLTDQSWHTLRDLTPCVVHGDLLIVAPSDSDRVFALDRDSGKMIWNTSVPADATKILGVGRHDQLIMSGRRLWWLDVYTGKPSQRVAVNPFPADATSEPVGVGRGLLSSHYVYWPATEDGESKIYVLRQSNGKPGRQPIDLEKRDVAAGNLIAVPGYLLISAPNELAVFELN